MEEHAIIKISSHSGSFVAGYDFRINRFEPSVAVVPVVDLERNERIAGHRAHISEPTIRVASVRTPWATHQVQSLLARRRHADRFAGAEGAGQVFFVDVEIDFGDVRNFILVDGSFLHLHELGLARATRHLAQVTHQV